MHRFCPTLVVLALALGATAARADEEAERRQIADDVQQAFAHRDWDRLEAMERAFVETRATTGSGLPKVVAFRGALGAAFDTAGKQGEQAIVSLETETLAWQQRHPASSFGVLLHAQALETHAFFFRGTGWAKTVRPEAWAPFYRYETAASKFLLDHREPGRRDSAWYAQLIGTGKCLDWGLRRVTALADEGSKAFPDDQMIHRAMIEYLSPRWQGNARQLAAYVDRVSSQATGGFGPELYARLYLNAAVPYGGPEALFKSTFVDWRRMRDGLDRLTAKYPTGFNLNMYAHYACAARDKPTTRRLLAQVRGDLVESRWQPGGMETYAACVNWSSAPENDGRRLPEPLRVTMAAP